ncbi:MAG: aminopeptidase [Planctomycetales bacterium]|nr:aminopeptidase [Planctomycetales bacterium]
MRDPRYDKLAKVLVNYSTNVRPGDLVSISGPANARDLLVAIYRQVVIAGGHPMLKMAPDECKEIMLEAGSEEQLCYENPVLQFEIENIDVMIALWGSDNTKALSRTAPARQSLLSQGRKRWSETYLQRAADGAMRWVGTQAPCHASAQDAEMSLCAYEDFVFGGGLLNHPDPAVAWQEISERQQRLVDFLNGKKELRFVATNGTDLRLGIDGRTWINCDGHENFPDGEVFTGPIESATEGIVRYSFPAVHGGRECDGICLKFEHGKVVDATAAKGEEFLIAMLDQDEGARTLGEIAIGTNYSIKQYTKNTLFDEKIGGTFHAAVGAAYPETGGKNKSGLHWDMVCDLRPGGTIYVDGEVISRDGRFVNPHWPKAD